VAAKPRSQWHRAQLAEITLSLRDGDVRQGVAMPEELHNEFPSVPQHKYRLACACERLGAMLRRDPAQQPDAEQYLRRAVQLLTELTRDFPDTPDYHSHLAAALDTLMSLPRNIIRLEEARQLIDVAIERQRAAVEANPAHRQYREQLASGTQGADALANAKSLLGAALHGQGNLLLAQEAWSEATTLFQQALEHQ
jgi:tetratricopeptide (TPR) repeat protein